MNRKDIINWIKSEVCPKLAMSQELNIASTIKAVEHFRVSHKINVNEKMTAEVNEYGHLFINGEHAGQITNKIPRSHFDEEGYYYEGLCLARSEE